MVVTGKENTIKADWLMSRQQEILILGAVEAINKLATDQDDKRSLLKKVFPYLTQSDLDHWISFYKL